MAITWESITSGAGLGLGSSGDVWAQLARAINDRRAAVNLGATNFSYLGTSPANGSGLNGEPIVEATKTLIDEMAESLQAAVTGSITIKFTDSDWSTYTGAGSESDGDVADGSYTSAHTGGFRGAIVRFREVIDDLIYIESKPTLISSGAAGIKTNSATPSFSGSGGTVAAINAPAVSSLAVGPTAGKGVIGVEYNVPGTFVGDNTDHLYMFWRELNKFQFSSNWRAGKTISEIEFIDSSTSSHVDDVAFQNGSFSHASLMSMSAKLYLCTSAQFAAATRNATVAGTVLRSWENSDLLAGINVFGSLDLASIYSTTPSGHIYIVFEPAAAFGDDPYPALTAPASLAKWEHTSSGRESDNLRFRIARDFFIDSLSTTLRVRYSDPPSD